MFVGRWPEAELERSCDIRLAACRQQWDQPALVLNAPRKSKSWPGEDIGVYSDIVLVSALREIAGVESSVPQFDADFLARAQPIVGADLFTLCSTSDPGSDQPSIVVVSAVVLRVGVNADTAKGRPGSCSRPQVSGPASGFQGIL